MRTLAPAQLAKKNGASKKELKKLEETDEDTLRDVIRDIVPTYNSAGGARKNKAKV